MNIAEEATNHIKNVLHISCTHLMEGYNPFSRALKPTNIEICLNVH